MRRGYFYGLVSGVLAGAILSLYQSGYRYVDAKERVERELFESTKSLNKPNPSIQIQTNKTETDIQKHAAIYGFSSSNAPFVWMLYGNGKTNGYRQSDGWFDLRNDDGEIEVEFIPYEASETFGRIILFKGNKLWVDQQLMEIQK